MIHEAWQTWQGGSKRRLEKTRTFNKHYCSAQMGRSYSIYKEINVHKILVRKPEGKTPFWKPRDKWEDNTKMAGIKYPQLWPMMTSPGLCQPQPNLESISKLRQILLPPVNGLLRCWSAEEILQLNVGSKPWWGPGTLHFPKYLSLDSFCEKKNWHTDMTWDRSSVLHSDHTD